MPLYVQHLTLGPAAKPLCTDLSLTLAPGETMSILGASHSGKSSLLLCLAGQLQPQSGRVGVGPDAERLHSPRWGEIGLGPIPVLAPLFETLTVREHLSLQAKLYRVRGHRQRVQEQLHRYQLETVARRRLKDLDAFTAVRAAIAITTVHRPQFILLDEPDKDLSEAEWQETTRLLQALADEGSGVVFTTVNASHAAWADVKVNLGDEGEVRREPVDRHSH
ncbi:ATP-binding cassette domain-containing protein [Alicyclobacillus herbarius]|uniref:ATP-binding cassette domain-containing protein n=1 Tax=Alicyclobacillus herbarius TaxID=122960 RepID=UPI000416AB3B|nr:ATP-binding cassette domain-containing protein [Alicyclobacillus herbarius]